MNRFVALALVIGFPLAGALAVGCDDESLAVTIVDGADATTSDAMASQSDSAALGEGAAPAPLRVLFIGNSYTFVNDVPGILARIAATAGQGPTIMTDEVVQAGATLAELAPAGAARIAERTWTHVVLQEQSIDPALSPGSFLTSAKQLGDQIADAGAQATWFVTWARAAADSVYPGAFYTPDEMQDRLTTAYGDAFRQRPGSLLSCVGEAFRASLRDHPQIVLHQPDNSHATVAGSYLAASTFYVALTGSPVPPAAEVPAEIGAAEAAILRQVANVGSDCAEVRTRGIVTVKDMSGSADWFLADGGVADPFDYAVAAVRIPARLKVANAGAVAATIAASTLSGPFEWTSGAFPGGAGTTNGGLAFCTSALAPQSECVVLVSFTGQTSGIGNVTLDLANAYRTSASRGVMGTAGSQDRALLTVSQTTIPGEVILEGSFANLYFASGHTANLVVTNRGGAPTTMIGAGQPLASPFIWGTPAAEGFPGGSGSGSPVSDPSVTLPYCGAVLAPGGQCLLGIGYTTAIAEFFNTMLEIAYADAKGAAAANTAFMVQIFPPIVDAGAD